MTAENGHLLVSIPPARFDRLADQITRQPGYTLEDVPTLEAACDAGTNVGGWYSLQNVTCAACRTARSVAPSPRPSRYARGREALVAASTPYVSESERTGLTPGRLHPRHPHDDA